MSDERKRCGFHKIRGLVSAMLLSLALGVGSVQGGEAPPLEPRFVREGVVLPVPGAEPGSIRLDGKRSGLARRLPGPEEREGAGPGGWLVEHGWQPGREVALAWREGERTATLRITAPLRPEPLVWRWLGWGDEGWPGGGSEASITALAFSADGSLLGVGDEKGRAAVFLVGSGKRMWGVFRPGRVVKHLAFGEEGRVLYVGEQGPEGRLAAYDLAAPERAARWVVDSAPDLGSASPEQAAGAYGWVRQPGAYRLVATGGGVIAAYSRSWHSAGGAAALARVFRVEGRTGNIKWRFPPGEPAPRIITWMAADGDASRLALPLQLPGGAASTAGGAGASQLVVLDGAHGSPDFRYTVPPLPPKEFAEFWRGVALHPAGERMAASSQDGRGFLFAREAEGWKLRRVWTLVAPVRGAGGVVAATNGTLAVTAREVVFVTGPPFAPQPGSNPAGRDALAHPRANTAFGFDWDGRPLWIHRLQSDVQGVATDGGGRLLAVAQGREGVQDAGVFNGVVLLALSAGSQHGAERLLYRFLVAGRVPYGGVAVSPAGGWLALAEAPRKVANDPRRKGAHGVWLLR